MFYFLDAPSIPTRTPHMPNTWKLGVAHSPFMVRWAVPPPFLVSHPLLVGEAGGPAMAWSKLPWPWERKHQESTSNRWLKCPKTPLILLKKWKNGKFWPMATGCQMELVPERMVSYTFFGYNCPYFLWDKIRSVWITSCRGKKGTKNCAIKEVENS